MAPLILVRRTTVADDDRLPVVSTNFYYPKYRMVPYRTMNMQYDRRAGQSGMQPSYEYYLADMPSYVRVSYDVIVWTDLMEQLNELVEAIFMTSDMMWGDFHTFRGAVRDMAMDSLNPPGEDRLVKATLTVEVDGYLRPEYTFQESNLTKAYSLKRVAVMNERDEHDLSIGEHNPIGRGDHISQEPLDDVQRNLRRNIRYR
jgi:hypothetical protein